jgi:uncharacterized protein (TIGR01777 family)
MRIAVSGSTGFIGAALCRHLESTGHEVTPIVRRPPPAAAAARVVGWDPDRGEIDRQGLEGHDAVVHLAGENIGAGRWNSRRKRRIRESRQRGTALLAATLAGLRQPPRALVSASAIGFYGDRPPEVTLDEAAGPGAGFLAAVCIDWEEAAAPARLAGIRVLHPRFGVVLDPDDGALARMLPVFRLGLGGRTGDGRQVMSWIALEEVPRALLHLLEQEAIDGPVNIVAPVPVTNAEFAAALGRALRRPAFLPLPALAVRLLLGEMGRELLLSGARVVPSRLLESGYRFLHPDLEEALRAMLGRDL